MIEDGIMPEEINNAIDKDEVMHNPNQSITSMEEKPSIKNNISVEKSPPVKISKPKHKFSESYF